jgi:hypothetical protein
MRHTAKKESTRKRLRLACRASVSDHPHEVHSKRLLLKEAVVQRRAGAEAVVLPVAR